MRAIFIYFLLFANYSFAQIKFTVSTDILAPTFFHSGSVIAVADMNADGLEDIIVIYNDGFLELYLNLGGVFRKKQKIAYLPQITSR